MPRNEASELEGHEFELVLGNKQLLSVFFIVVILLGIFFTMGYVVGRNSAPVDTAVRRSEGYERQNAPSAMPAASPKRETSSGNETPAQSAASESGSTPPASRTKAEPAAQMPIEIPPVTVSEPQVGQMYLQVLAVAKPEADVLAEVLVKKGFRAMVAPGPNDKVFRVLVGPAKDTADAGRLKVDLEAAGFKPFLKKY